MWQSLLSTTYNYVDDEALPSWVFTFDRILAHFAAGARLLKSQTSDQRQLTSAPFEEILAPFALYYRAEIDRLAGHLRPLMEDAAASSLERQLLRTLCHWALLPLHLEFQTFLRTTAVAENEDTSGRTRYLAFCSVILSGAPGGLFFVHYATLARLLTQATCDAITNTIELLQRFSRDRAELAHFVTAHTEIYIRNIETGLSDPHRGGRTVLKLTVSSGVPVIYKPRTVTAEAAFSRLIVGLRRNRRLLKLRSLKVLEREGYGWVEYVEPAASENAKGKARFYFRLGMLLGLGHFLCGTDFHFENIIAAGEHPVLVDLEVLFTPSVRLFDALKVGPVAFWESVLRTGILPKPFANIGSGGATLDYDISALRAGLHKTRFPWYVISDVNSDKMTVRFERITLAPDAHLPDGTAELRDEDGRALIQGFRRIYREFSARKNEILDDAGPIARFLQSRFRFVFRATQIYARLLQRLTLPLCLRDGLDFGIEVEALRRAVYGQQTEENKNVVERVSAFERTAIENRDIPYFSFDPQGSGLLSEHQEVVPEFFSTAGKEKVWERINSLTESDLAFQVRLIEGSLHIQQRNRSRHLPSGEEGALSASRAACLKVAQRIGAAILRKAVLEKDGSAKWISFGLAGMGDKLFLEQCDATLYSGQIGIALFLSALYQQTEQIRFCQGSLAALRNIALLLGNEGRRERASLGLDGLGGCLLGISRCRQFLQGVEEAGVILDDICIKIEAAVSRIDPVADNTFDVISGSAGLILGLCEYRKNAKSAALRGILEGLGDRLHEAKQLIGNGLWAWETLPNEPPLNGFAHGSAGIGYALGRLYAVLPKESYFESVKDAYRFEESTILEPTGVWRDLRAGNEGEQCSSISWCHGVTGIGLARLGSLGLFNDEHTRERLECALKYCTSEAAAVDSLCCGEAGRIDFLIEAALRLGRPSLLQVARRDLQRLALRAESSKGFHLLSGITATGLFPSLFQGSAGIGYIALRAANPERYPTVLL